MQLVRPVVSVRQSTEQLGQAMLSLVCGCLWSAQAWAES